MLQYRRYKQIPFFTIWQLYIGVIYIGVMQTGHNVKLDIIIYNRRSLFVCLFLYEFKRSARFAYLVLFQNFDCQCGMSNSYVATLARFTQKCLRILCQVSQFYLFCVLCEVLIFFFGLIGFCRVRFRLSLLSSLVIQLNRYSKPVVLFVFILLCCLDEYIYIQLVCCFVLMFSFNFLALCKVYLVYYIHACCGFMHACMRTYVCCVDLQFQCLK
eukprot:TRINITY_DN4342_c0_g1_i9.p4 TRINITY_DN4342_c0_g1~~TRINITY_DN4342_c0_g1_i9.p4  ORF type:complete len:214 (+),score=-4.81 TRINITY_DN4342_c0_g1_i9:1606-2247(+)